ncbi:hypothetical protein GCM10009737_03580 [Nocardioides lentus]|uniref:Uncharacterized protein n=1 Tax=Nocardioides lentus TaxID=338077 RepID=A0ABP5A7L4_9ACTN
MPAAPDQPPGRRAGGRAGPLAAAAALLASALGATPATAASAAEAAPAASAPTSTAAPAAAAAPGDDPLDVVIDTVGPAELPERGPLTLTGSVTNDSIETWEDVNVYALFSASPLTTAAELADASALPADALIGERITETGAFADVGDLEPGTTRSFSLRLPGDLLPDAGDGVYWTGVQALGADSSGRDEIADGRARTFVPRVTASTRDDDVGEVDTAFVVPVRHPVRRDADGRVRNLAAWSNDLAPGGRLDRLLDFGAEASGTGSSTVTWLLDPAVPDTVAELVAGNDGLSIAPSVQPGPDDTDGQGGGQDGGQEGEEPDAEPSSSAPTDDDTDDDTDDGTGDGASPSPSEAETDPAVLAAQERAARGGRVWLEQLREVLGDGTVLALPYGDIDVDAVARADPDLYDRARVRSEQVTAAQGIDDAEPVVLPPSGYLDPATLEAIPTTDTVVVADTALPEPPEGSRVRVAGRDLAVTAAAPATGGPDPGDRLSPVAVRQRLVSEAALRLLAADPEDAARSDPSLVVTMPSSWDPTPGTGFFRALDEVDWLNLTSLDDALGGAGGDIESSVIPREPAAGLDAEALAYPDAVRAREVPEAAVEGAGPMIDSAISLQDVLPLNDTVAEQAADEALVALSYANRGSTELSRRAITLARRHVEGMLGEITVEAPTSLTLSSDSGDFSVQLSNGLDQPVVVRLRAVTDGPLEIRAPAEVEVPPQAGTTIRMPVATSRVGLTTVEVELTDSAGNAIGASDSLPVRSVQIGVVIWWILGVGTALLFSAILVRLVRRIRAARRSGATA